MALCVGFSPIVSYASDNVLVYDEPHLQYYDDFMQVLREYAPVVAESDANGYYIYNSPSHNMVYSMSWGNMYVASDFDSYLPEIYDYYLLFTAYADVSVDDFSFKPDMAKISFQNCEPSSDVAFGVRYYHHDKRYAPFTGFTVTAKLPEYDNTMPNYIYLYDSTLGTVPDAQLRVKVQILQVEKDSTPEIDISALLDKLDTVNNSIVEGLDDLERTIEEQYAVEDSENFGVGNIVEDTENKLGALTFASDTMIGMLDLFDSENAGDAVLTFPSFEINVQGQVYRIWNDVQFDFSVLEDNFGVLIEAVRWGTTMCVYMALCMYIGKAYGQIIGG